MDCNFDDHSRSGYAETPGHTPEAAIREFLCERKIGHLTTKPYRPQTNGKVERLEPLTTNEGPQGSGNDTPGGYAGCVVAVVRAAVRTELAQRLARKLWVRVRERFIRWEGNH